MKGFNWPEKRTARIQQIFNSKDQQEVYEIERTGNRQRTFIAAAKDLDFLLGGLRASLLLMKVERILHLFKI